jgi:transporter family protein
MSWQWCALASACFAALTAILAKVGVRDVDSNLATAVRTVVIVLFAWGIVVVQGSYRALPSLSGRTWLFLVLSGLATGASWLFYFQALKLGPASRVAPLDKMSVPITVLLAVILLHESLTWQVGLGVALITAGALLLIR